MCTYIYIYIYITNHNDNNNNNINNDLAQHVVRRQWKTC